MPTPATLLLYSTVTFLINAHPCYAIAPQDGQVMTFGSGGYGQLGRSSEDPTTYPAKIDGLDQVSQIACGR